MIAGSRPARWRRQDRHPQAVDHHADAARLRAQPLEGARGVPGEREIVIDAPHLHERGEHDRAIEQQRESNDGPGERRVQAESSRPSAPAAPAAWRRRRNSACAGRCARCRNRRQRRQDHPDGQSAGETRVLEPGHLVVEDAGKDGNVAADHQRIAEIRHDRHEDQHQAAHDAGLRHRQRHMREDAPRPPPWLAAASSMRPSCLLSTLSRMMNDAGT